jgi:hypothetical protein
MATDFDPFDPSHPSLSRREVEVVVGEEKRAIDWAELHPSEREELERLLAKACGHG